MREKKKHKKACDCGACLGAKRVEQQPSQQVSRGDEVGIREQRQEVERREEEFRRTEQSRK